MKVGVVGFRGSGKTTVFNALTGLNAETGGFSSADKANLGIIKVPDERVDILTEIYEPKKTIFAEVMFADLAGTTPEAGGKGFSSQMLAEMRNADALVHVVRDFDNPGLSQARDPKGDAERFNSELVLADLMVVEKRLERLHKEGNKGRETKLFERLTAHLEEDRPLRTMAIDEAEEKQLASYAFLSRKPMLLLINTTDDKASDPVPEPLVALSGIHENPLFVMSAQVEMELNDLDDEEKKDFLSDLGLEEPARLRFIKAVYSMLDLMSFLTVGKDEVRAWTIRKGTPAVKAAGKIHSDIERGFIRAEVTDYRDLVETQGNEAKCRELGKMRLEGKEYVIQDGEVVHFRFNV